MENSTKALLIAAAVLIAIVIVVLAIRILGSANNPTDASERTASELESGTEKGAKTHETKNRKMARMSAGRCLPLRQPCRLRRKARGSTLWLSGAGQGYPYAKSCVVSDIRSNSITVKNREGGVVVAFPIHLPDSTKQYHISFDYSGEGKVRAYWSYANSSTGATTSAQSIVVTDSEAYINAGTSGSIDKTISAPARESYGYLILMLSSNTGKTKTYTNILVNEVN